MASTTPLSSGAEHTGANGESRLFTLLNNARRDLQSQNGRFLPNLNLALETLETALAGGLIDDRKYLVESVIQLAASLPNESKLRGDLNAQFIGTLWNNLRHPPLSYLGEEFKYRAADGSNNNIMYPHLGASGSYYARSVAPTRRQNLNLPDPSVIFDNLFHTDEADRSKVKNSSYLDLGPLYGNNMDEQKRVRLFKDGLLKMDTFSERRLLSQPPGVCAMMVAFNRFHNYIAHELGEINERGRFSLPPGVTSDHPQYDAAQAKRDNDIFQTARLITCGLYVNIILGDYLRTILNLNRNPIPSDWKLDPRADFKVFDSEGIPRGIGNQVSVEFNMIYRWHSATSGSDETWTKELFHKIFGSQVNWGAFSARNIPRVLKAVEMLGIQQSRDWGVASLNEFREFCKLKPYSSFADMNPDPSIAEALEELYEHPDNIELYPGLLAEDAKKELIPGSGLCPGFTNSFAILSDAVALVRGDRFYTVDYNASNLTAFGFNEANSDFDVAGGGVMYKLLMRAFPGWYRANSVYAHYPFTTPDGNREIFQKRSDLPELDYSKPTFVGPPLPVLTWQGVTDALNNQQQFRVPWGPHTFQLINRDYMLSGDSPANARQRETVKKCLYAPKDGLDQVRQFYEATTAKFIRQYSRKMGKSYQVDIVRDYTEASLADTLGNLFAYVFLDLDTAQSFKRRVVATKQTRRLGEVMQKVVAGIKAQHFPSLGQLIHPDMTLGSYGPRLVGRLLDGGGTVDDIVWTIIPTAAAASATQAQGWGQMIDLYLSDEYFPHWTAIRELALSEEPEAFEKLKKYALEGFRLSTPAFGLIRSVAGGNSEVNDGARVVSVKTGDALFADFITAGRDPSKFPEPEKIKLDRPDELYIHHGWGPHACLGRAIVTVAGASMLRTCARLTNFRRAPGPAGEMKSRTENGAFKRFLSEDGSQWGPFPVTKKVLFDHDDGAK
ncbi:hypothetical protein ACHAQH_004158 [Verticillium albo-atrum]